TFHDKSECNELKSRRATKDQTSKNDKGTLLLREPITQTKDNILERSIYKKDAEFLFDSDSHNNYIPETQMKKMGLKWSTPETERLVEVGNGSRVKIIGAITCNIILHKLQNISFKIRLEIIEGTLSQILLGQSFLTQQEVAIDYRDQQIKIAGHTIFFGSELTTEWQNTPDSQLLEKVRTIKKTTQTEQLLKSIYNEEMILNILPAIPGFAMHIILTKEQPIISKSYQTPFKLREQVEDEIK
ncbi:hypothetical protein ENBRE01_2095, partial [Enteropsectra breve]